EHQELEQQAVIMDGHAPFAVVVIDHQRIAFGPATSLHAPHPTLPREGGGGFYSRIVPDLPPWFFEPKGRYDEHIFESEVLKANPLHDPHRRPLWVYLPPGYDAEPGRRYPSIYLIQGLTGQIDIWRNRKAFRHTFPELADAQ